jgi:hypothetical protein
MIPQLPDNLYRILLTIGLFLIGYSFYQYQNVNLTFKAIQKSNSNIDGIIDSVRFENKLQIILSNRAITSLLERHKFDSPVSIDDTAFIQRTYSPLYDKNVKDSILVIYIEYLQKSKTHAMLLSHYKNEKQAIANELEEYETTKWAYYLMALFGSLSFILGYYGIYNEQSVKDTILVNQQRNLHIPHIRCQSCGKVFSSMVKFGQEQDNCASKSFCNGCYKNGKFTEPDITFSEIESRALGTIERTKKERRLLSKLLRNLDRWRIDIYSDQ